MDPRSHLFNFQNPYSARTARAHCPILARPIVVQMAKTLMAVAQETYDIINKGVEDHGFVIFTQTRRSEAQYNSNEAPNRTQLHVPSEFTLAVCPP